MTSTGADLQAFARLIESLTPWLDQVVIIGGLGAPPASSSSRRADPELCSSYDARRRCRATDRVEGERPGHL
jgi:hypothetical protein